MKGFVSVLVGFALAIAIIAVGNFGFHIPEGGGRGWLFAGAAAVFLLFAFGPGRLWGRGGNLNSFALPVLLLLHVTLNGWWLLGLLVAVVWAWAFTRKEEGGGYLRGINTAFAMVAAAIFTVALVIGVGATLLLK